MNRKLVYKKGQGNNPDLLESIVDECRRIFQDNNQSVKILDLATGPNAFNPELIRLLNDAEIKYKLFLTDIYEPSIQRGFSILSDVLDEHGLQGELQNVEYIQTDITLQPFASGSFDLIMGVIPYGSINTGNYSQAIQESYRVLSDDSPHIVCENQNDQMRSKLFRLYNVANAIIENPSMWWEWILSTKNAWEIASKDNFIQEFSESLSRAGFDIEEVFVRGLVYEGNEQEPDQIVLKNDLIREVVYLARK